MKENNGIDAILWQAYKELPLSLRKIIRKEKYFIAGLRFKGKEEGYVVIDLMKKRTDYDNTEDYADHTVRVYNEFIRYQNKFGKIYSCKYCNN